MELIDILRCPRTGNRLRFGDGNSVVRVHGSDVTYPVVDGIVDFCPDVKNCERRAKVVALGRSKVAAPWKGKTIVIDKGSWFPFSFGGA